MGADLRLHVFRRAELRDGIVYQNMRDPEQLAPFPAEKRQALLDCPAGEEDDPVQVIGTQNDLVIGRIDFVPGLLHIMGGPLRVSYGSSLSVPPAHRNTLMGVMLIMKAQSLHPVAAASGPSQAVIPVYQKLRWFDLLIPRFIMILRSRSVERYLGGGLLARACSKITDVFLVIYRAMIRLFAAMYTAGLHARQVDKMDAEYDPQLARQRRDVCAHRSAAWINWQLSHTFKSNPRDGQNLYYVMDDAGRVAGYFITKVRFYETATHREFKDLLLGSVQDWMIFDPSKLNAKGIALLALRTFFQQKVDAVEFCTDESELLPLLRMCGFLRVGEMHFMMRAAAGTPLADAKLHDISRWWIRPGDGDSFFT